MAERGHPALGDLDADFDLRFVFRPATRVGITRAP